MRRVVRLTSETPRRDSIKARCLLTAGVVMPISRAAALRLPALASVEKKPRSAGSTLDMAAPLLSSRLTMDSL